MARIFVGVGVLVGARAGARTVSIREGVAVVSVVQVVCGSALVGADVGTAGMSAADDVDGFKVDSCADAVGDDAGVGDAALLENEPERTATFGVSM